MSVEDRIMEELEGYLREHPFCGECLDDLDVEICDEGEDGTVYYEATAYYSAEVFGHYVNLEIEISGKYNRDSDELTVDSVYVR